MSVPLIDFSSSPEFPTVVVRLAPFHFTTEPLTNPLPFTVRLNAAPPAVADDGDSELMEGVGLFGGLMVNEELRAVRRDGVGVNTVTCAVPDAAISAALIEA